MSTHLCTISASKKMTDRDLRTVISDYKLHVHQIITNGNDLLLGANKILLLVDTENPEFIDFDEYDKHIIVYRSLVGKMIQTVEPTLIKKIFGAAKRSDAQISTFAHQLLRGSSSGGMLFDPDQAGVLPKYTSSAVTILAGAMLRDHQILIEYLLYLATYKRGIDSEVHEMITAAKSPKSTEIT